MPELERWGVRAMCVWRWMAAAGCCLGIGVGVVAAGQENARDNVPAGWIRLFDGKTLEGWMTSGRTESKKPVEDGAINPHGAGGYMMIHKQQWSDFVLSLRYRLSKGCNSGIFVRTFPLTPRSGKDVGFNGIEIALDDTAPSAGLHDSGAVYDLAAPSRNPQRPAGEWNDIEVTCKGPLIKVVLNGELVNVVDLDRFTLPNRRPDGSEHKFDIAFKNHPRRGYIGLQDHGSDCWFRDVRLKPLP